jgi:hypothetical protein
LSAKVLSRRRYLRAPAGRHAAQGVMGACKQRAELRGHSLHRHHVVPGAVQAARLLQPPPPTPRPAAARAWEPRTRRRSCPGRTGSCCTALPAWAAEGACEAAGADAHMARVALTSSTASVRWLYDPGAPLGLGVPKVTRSGSSQPRGAGKDSCGGGWGLVALGGRRAQHWPATPDNVLMRQMGAEASTCVPGGGGECI